MSGYLFGYGVLAAITLFLIGAERVWPASTFQRGEWLNNAGAFALTALCQMVLIPLLAVSETGLINQIGGGLIDLRQWPWSLGALAYLVAMDLGEYLFHRAQHTIPWMWAMHSLHHSDRALNVASSQRHFWLEPALKSVSIGLVVALAFKVNGEIVAVYFFTSFYHLIVHANLRLGFGRFSWIWNSPQYHRLHHSREAQHYNTNFAALLPVFDVISGSYQRPRRDEFPETGLDERVAAPLELIVWPVRAVLRRRDKVDLSSITR
jgi:sterol desaturase/sphingolipid hydroxylase (fatty acid hydroxylase superfamily)